MLRSPVPLVDSHIKYAHRLSASFVGIATQDPGDSTQPEFAPESGDQFLFWILQYDLQIYTLVLTRIHLSQGKSTLTNWLLRDERCLTGPEPVSALLSSFPLSSSSDLVPPDIS